MSIDISLSLSVFASCQRRREGFNFLPFCRSLAPCVVLLRSCLFFASLLQVKSTAGDPFLGGEDFDSALLAHIARICMEQHGARSSFDSLCSRFLVSAN